jgi:(p)ppGpp synthase/HD superfamily hydrolase
LDKIKEAREFAIIKHGDQKYGDDKPYVVHLDGVSEVLSKYGFTQEMFPHLHIVAYLHDTMEDTQTTSFEISEKFGSEVLKDVWALTEEPGKNRKERHQKTFPKLFKRWTARCVKLADRISNVDNCTDFVFTLSKKHQGLFDMYKKEYPEFFQMMYFGSDGLENMWNHLNMILTRRPIPSFDLEDK